MLKPGGAAANHPRYAKHRQAGQRRTMLLALAAFVLLSWLSAYTAVAGDSPAAAPAIVPAATAAPPASADAAKSDATVQGATERQRRFLMLLLLNGAALRPLSGFGR